MELTVHTNAQRTTGSGWWQLIAIVSRVVPLLFAVLLVGMFVFAARPTVVPGVIPGFVPDSPDYAYGAAALLRGEYTVEWPGPEGERHVPRYTPGYAIMLAPVVLFGGVGAAVVVSYLMAIVLLCLGAALAYRLAGPSAAFCCVVFLALPRVLTHHAGIVMSDLPSAALLLLELWVVLLARDRRWWVVAGMIAGWLIWIRPANALLLLAGLAAATAARKSLACGAAYLSGAAPWVLGLGVWQWWMFGSPLRTGYQAAGAGAAGGQALDTFFSLRYIVSPAWGSSNRVGAPTSNFVDYLGAFLGAQSYLILPGVAIVGALVMVIFARRRGVDGQVGRFGGVVVLTLLALYVPYFWYDPRFLIAPAAFLSLCASVALPRIVQRIVRAARPVFFATS